MRHQGRALIGIPAFVSLHLCLVLAFEGLSPSLANAAPLNAKQISFLLKLREAVKEDTTSHLLDRMVRHRRDGITAKQAQDMLAASLATRKPRGSQDFTWQFEAATGKLKFGSDKEITKHLKVGHREVNVYHATAGAVLVVCLAESPTAKAVSWSQVTEARLRTCIKSATDKLFGFADFSKRF